MHRAVRTGVPVLGNDVQAALVSRVCSDHEGGAAYGVCSEFVQHHRLHALLAEPEQDDVGPGQRVVIPGHLFTVGGRIARGKAGRAVG